MPRSCVAVATKGGGRINEHFGHAKEFQIYELSTAGAKFVGHRRVDLYCQGGFGDEDKLPTVIRAIDDCTAVFVAKVGACPKEELLKAGIEPVEQYAHEFIEQSAIAYFKDYLKKIESGETTPAQRARRADPARRLHRRLSELLFIKLENEHGLQDYRFPMHELLSLRGGVPERRHPREGRHLSHQSEEMHRVPGPFRLAAMRRCLSGRRHLRDRRERSALSSQRLTG